jgi:hypothetical protein
MPITLNHSNIGVQYSSDKSYIIETVKSDLYRDNIIANNIQAAPVIPSIYIENNNVYAVESYAYTGSANTADYVREFPKDTLCDILVVGGGGSGSEAHGGGGGAGAVIFMKNVTMNGNYTIKVGTGGVCEVTAGVNGRGKKGIDSEIFKTNNVNNKIIAEGGGGGGQLANANGGSGGSGGGGDAHSVAAGLGGAATPYTPILDGVTGIKYGNNGGNAFGAPGHGGGGGGAGGVGENALAGYNTNTEQERAHGGVGIKSATINSVNYDFKTLFGTNTGGGVLESDGFLYFGGGGGNGRWSGPSYGSEGGNGGLGGGGKGGWATSTVSVQPLGGKGYPGINGTGGGGGGGGDNKPAGGNGGSGIVIIRYLVLNISSNLLTTEPTITTATTFTESIRTFTHSGGAEAQTTYTITVGRDTICDILIVGGGGGGGKTDAGGGGAGGLIYIQNITLFGNYTIQVGKKGLGGKSASTISLIGEKGGNSSIIGANANYIAYGGGGGGYGHPSDVEPGNLGPYGSSGGLGTSDQTRESFNINTPGQGHLGGLGTAVEGGGGGGGSGGPGVNSGNGGIGTQINITGTNLYYAGGGGGGHNPSGTSGGLGGGGSATFYIGNNATFYGGGGGGGGAAWGNGGDGFDGIVIIKFKSLVGPILEGTTHKRLNFAYNNDNLVAWYRFNNDYLDSSGNGHNLTNVGTVIQSTQVIEGQAVEFDSTDYLEFPATINPYTIWNGKGITFSFWVRFTSITGTYSRFIDFQSGASSVSGIMFAFRGNSEAFYLNSGAAAATFSYSNLSNSIITTLGVWHHIVWSIDITGKWDVYLNNVRINNTETSAVPNITYNLRYINKSVYTGNGVWGGQMDDFRIYDRALSAADVASLYNKTYPAPSNTYTVNFQVPTIADINNNSNIVLRGAYDIALTTTNAVITPKTGQYIPKPTTFASDLLSIRYNILNPLNDPTGAQWTYSSNNTNMCHIGSVGIGTTNPEYQLDVNGSVNAKSYYLNGRQINEPLSELGLSEGMIAQVRHLTYTQMEVKNNLNWDAINDNLTTGFVIAITPKSNLSKILLNIIVHIGLVVSGSSMWWGIKLYRKIGAGDWTEVTGPNGTETGSAAATAGTPVWISYTMYGGDTDYQYKVTNVTGTYLDSPNTTSTVYYTAHWNQRIGDNPDYPTNTVIYLNRAESHGDAYRPAPSSSWTASEIWYG